MIRAAIFNSLRLRNATLLAFLAAPLLVATARAESVLDAIGAEVNHVYLQTRPAIVRVKVEGEGRPRSGTGFFLDSSGKVLTTASVAGKAKRTWIEWEQQQLPAELIGADARSNLALLQVGKTGENEARFPCLPLGDSKALRVGTPVIAIGSPFDLPPSPSFGIVGGFDQHESSRIFVTSHIRTDLPLSPGEGGSPLLNTRGEVVGIIVATANQGPTCYALPSRAIQRLVKDLEEFGEARYGWIGVTVLQCTAPENAATKHGSCIKVQQVFSNTPAARAGIQTDDKILKIGDAPVHRLCDMVDTTFAARVGDKVDLQVQRQTTLTNLTVEIAARPRSLPEAKDTSTASSE